MMMVIRRQLFRRAAIVGTGLMGASLGVAMKKKGLVQYVVGISRQQNTLNTAQKLGAMDEATTDFQKGIANADLIILATPVQTIIEFLPALGQHAKRGVIVTDLGSTKAMVVDRAQKLLPQHVLFVGSHPLVGSEKSGPAHAQENLYEQANVIMTPTDKTNRLAKEKIKHFWTMLGAHVKMMPPSDHDAILAHVSHLPHLLAYGLIKVIPNEYLEHASQGLKDTTRIAASDPKMWSDIYQSNSKNVLKALDEMVKTLSLLRKAIVEKDDETLMDVFRQAKSKRDRI